MSRGSADAGRSAADQALDRLMGELRPQLHRYCARMTGSVIDGEDVVQEAFVKAIEARSTAGSIDHPAAWLFRIAHNAALDFLRRRAHQGPTVATKDVEMVADPRSLVEDRVTAAAGLRIFMRLPVSQRSSVILVDVLGYTLREVSSITNTTVPAVKASLHRGRAQLREMAKKPEDRGAPVLAETDRVRLGAYVDRFNARDFEAVRNMLAEDVRLEVVNRVRKRGRDEAGNYFDNYARNEDWRLVPGLVDGRPAVLVRDPGDPDARAKYFIVVEWVGDEVAAIRDFRYARYAIEDAELFA